VDSSISTINFYLTTNLSYSPINLQGLSWSFAFSISEVTRPDYIPITEALANNKLARLSMEERDEMLQELETLKQRELQRLQRYKEKLTKKEQPVETPTEVVTPSPAPAGPMGVDYGSGSRMMDYQPSIVYPNIFDDPARRPEDAVFQEINP
jgi:hypothetical protein